MTTKKTARPKASPRNSSKHYWENVANVFWDSAAAVVLGREKALTHSNQSKKRSIISIQWRRILHGTLRFNNKKGTSWMFVLPMFSITQMRTVWTQCTKNGISAAGGLLIKERKNMFSSVGSWELSSSLIGNKYCSFLSFSDFSVWTLIETIYVGNWKKHRTHFYFRFF